ncbi:MAG TPA: hypothetical protein VFP50_20730 [Anaeromyxobacteraceae bacterium]|nr:hypothetical protein [Anaeromyxobacteraceae bacterium]
MEYVQWPNGITVGAIEVAPDVRDAAGLADAVRLLVGEVSGATLVVRSADSSSFQGANAGELGIVVANRISFKKGKDWKEYGPGAPEHLG